MALRLYEKYAAVAATGEENVSRLLEDIYLAGNITNWETKSPAEWIEIKKNIAENRRVVEERAASTLLETVTMTQAPK